MATPKQVDSGKTLLERVAAKLKDPGKKAQLAALMDGEDEALADLGDGFLRREEGNRLMQEVQARTNAAADWHNRLQGWVQSKQNELVEGRAAKGQLAQVQAQLKKLDRVKQRLRDGDDPDDVNAELSEILGATVAIVGTGGAAAAQPAPGQPGQPAHASMTPEEVQRFVFNREALGLNQISLLNDLVDQYRDDFGKPLRRAALLDYWRGELAQGREITLEKAYELFTAEEREAKAKADHTAEIQAAERRGREAYQRELEAAGHVPPLLADTDSGGGGETVGLLRGQRVLKEREKEGTGAVSAVDRAVARFNELSQGRRAS